ncbi:MAG: ISKra4 family transposase [Chloroflexi bacterium]|nr:ISKra4 family transposase [Chloroflexota bacterium]
MTLTAEATCLPGGPVQGLPPSVESWSLARARQTFQALEAWLLSEEARHLPLHEVEREQESRGREVPRLLLEAHVAHRGWGEVGPALQVQAGGPQDEPVCHRHRRLDPRHPQTIFGQIRVDRLGYCHPRAVTVHPLDEQLHLPHRSFSSELQRRLVKAAVQGPFQEAVERVEEATGVRVPKRSAQQGVQEAACDFEAFYQGRRPPPEAQTGPILVGSVDGKGIPMVKVQPASRVVRRGKGQKANQKRMGVVATVYPQRPRIRSPEEVIENLFDLEQRRGKTEGETSPPPGRPEYKRVWASLRKGKAGVIEEMAQELERRDPQGKKDWVVLTDGERALQKTVRARLPGICLVLDFQHALSKLWQAAYAFHEEGSPQAHAWVRERALRILRGEVSQVVKGMRQSATKRKLTASRRKVVETAAAYFYRNRAHMQDQKYLQKGWPIATGVVEGACKNLVKDRMERSGMRWTAEMAEAILKLRATYLSKDFEEYWAFHLQQEHARLYPPGYWRAVNSVEEK